MPNEKHLAILLGALVKQDVSIWNRWRENNPDIHPDLNGANLGKANLVWARFSHTNLRKANFTGATLHGANLNGADLTGALLHEANLTGANFEGANLSWADLSMANLFKASLTDTDLSWADLSMANLFEATLSDANVSGTHFDYALFGCTFLASIDLKDAKRIETVRHCFPSYVDLSTVGKSGTAIPAVFFRGVGIPDHLIKYLGSLADRPGVFESPTVFIAHGPQDRLFCVRLHADLQASGVRCWYCPEQAQWGKPIQAEVDRKTKIFDKLVVVCSKHSLGRPQIQRETEESLRREETEHKNILLPVRLDDYVITGWQHPRKREVIGKLAGDFVGWEQDPSKYNASFQELVEAIKS